MEVNIKESLHQDMASLMRKELEEVGFDTSAISDENVPIKYFTVVLRLIEKKPRAIYKSKDFSCPSNLVRGLSILESKIKSGESLFPHQSKSIARLSSEDKMLYAWSIYHFHLGESIDSSGFITRTGPILFAFITDDAVYMIDIKSHGSWSDKGLIQILYNNWPSLLDSWKVNGTSEVNFDSEAITQLRRSNINTIITLDDGSCFMGPGLGFTTAGTPAEATLKVNNIKHHIDRFLRDLQKDPVAFLKTSYSDEDINHISSFDFDLHIEVLDQNKIAAVDKNSGIYQVLFEQKKFLKDKI